MKACSYTNQPGSSAFQNQQARGQYEERRELTLEELLAKERIIFVAGEINGNLACQVITLLLLHQSRRKKEEINVYINSPGGGVSSTLAIYDTMRFLDAPVATYAIGLAASGGAVLLSAGDKGRRFALPHAKIMIHQPRIYKPVGGQATDIEILAKNSLRDREDLVQILCHHTGKQPDIIRSDIERDRYFTAQEAKEYGLVDEVLEHLTDDEGPKQGN